MLPLRLLDSDVLQKWETYASEDIEDIEDIV